jgi:hypothetical protein
MTLDQTAVTANPQRPPSPDLTGDRGYPPRSASSLLFEGVGVGATIGAATVGMMGAVMALGTTLVMPMVGVPSGPIFLGLTGAGFGGIVGGLLGGVIGVSRAMFRG